MSLKPLEPRERRLWMGMEHQGRKAAQNSTSQWCSLSQFQLREEIERSKVNFGTNWKQTAYLEGHMQIADERYRERRHFGASLRGHFEAANTKSLKEWF